MNIHDIFIVKQEEINRDNKILYNKLFNIDKYGHKKIKKQLKPLYQPGKNLLSGYKKNEIMRVAQENLYMLKRLNEKTSFYNVDKLNKDYEMSQYYKKNHCLYSPIDFIKANKYLSGSIIKLTKKKFFNKTHYASTGKLEYVPPIQIISTSTRRRKKFEDFNYRDLNLDEREKSDIIENKEKYFKKISEIGSEEKKENEENKNNEIDNNNEQKGEEKKVENKEEEKKEEEDGDGGIKEQKQNKRDKKEENGGKAQNEEEKK